MRTWLPAILLTICKGTFALAQCDCSPLPPLPNDAVFVTNVSQLDAALSEANSNNGHTTIALETGIYELTTNLLFISSNMTHLTIRGASGNRDDVVIKGQGWNNSAVTHIFNVAADHFTLADLTIGEVYHHPIQIHSNNNGTNDADFPHIQNVRFYDAKEQLLKVSGGGDLFSDDGKVLCCLFEFSGTSAFQWYTGGIDAHRAINWDIKYNTFKNIRSPDSGLAEHAIHFWRASSGTEVEANLIINCDRGIGFGLGDSNTNGHVGGIIKNNFVHTSRDVGIGLEHAPDAKIYNNTVITDNYQNSIEYRFAGTNNVHIANNLTDAAVASRSGGSGTVESNYLTPDLNIFVDASNYDYHLATSDINIVDAGMTLAEVDKDFDCAFRPNNALSDIGADEYGVTTTHDVLLESSGISIYPNPIEDTFTISGLLTSYSIEVLDSLGQVYQTYNQATGTIEIDISTLPAGLYFIKIEDTSIGSPVNMQLILKS